MRENNRVMVVNSCYPSYCGKHKIEGWWSWEAWAKIAKTIYLINAKISKL
jgi:hypothetical protein